MLALHVMTVSTKNLIMSDVIICNALCRLNYTDGGYLDAPGVTVSTVDFGNLSSSAELNQLLLDLIENATNFVDYFVERGYTKDVSIRAAPYDWRLGGGISLY